MVCMCVHACVLHRVYSQKLLVHKFAVCVLVLPNALPLVTSSDPCVRHGALHVVAELTHSLRLMADKNATPFSEYVGPSTTSQLLQMAPKVSTPSQQRHHVTLT